MTNRIYLNKYLKKINILSNSSYVTLFNSYHDKPITSNHSTEELATYMDKIKNLYRDFLDTGITIGSKGNFITL